MEVDPGPRGSCVERGARHAPGDPPAYGMEISIAPELALPGEEGELRAIASVTPDAKADNVAGRFCEGRNITHSHTEFCSRLNLVLSRLGRCLGPCRVLGELRVEKLAGEAWQRARDKPRRPQPLMSSLLQPRGDPRMEKAAGNRAPEEASRLGLSWVTRERGVGVGSESNTWDPWIVEV